MCFPPVDGVPDIIVVYRGNPPQKTSFHRLSILTAPQKMDKIAAIPQ